MVLCFFFTEDTSADDISAMITWLKHNKDPVSQVKSYMARTAQTRALFIREHPEESVNSIIAVYPRLVDVPGMVSYVLFCINPGI